MAPKANRFWKKSEKSVEQRRYNNFGYYIYYNQNYNYQNFFQETGTSSLFLSAVRINRSDVSLVT